MVSDRVCFVNAVYRILTCSACSCMTRLAFDLKVSCFFVREIQCCLLFFSYMYAMVELESVL